MTETMVEFQVRRREQLRDGHENARAVPLHSDSRFRYAYMTFSHVTMAQVHGVETMARTGDPLHLCARENGVTFEQAEEICAIAKIKVTL